MRELVADHPAGLPDDPTSPLPDLAELPMTPCDLDDEAYDDVLVLPFGEASGWRGAS
ncbi:hypothetical protein ACFU7D_02465 [Nocardioides sp. NPDC057577]|uniref:hypothetical protein n=1 Tax=Nocardioides sp. NPDC057577 TaxID=3346171 RepID=UPI00366CB7C5